MTKIQSSRAIGIALMVLFLAMALPATAQESAPLCHCAGVTVERLNNQGLFRVVASFVGSGQARLFDQTVNAPIANTVRPFSDNSVTWELTLVSPSNVVQINTDNGQSWQTQPGCVLVLPPPLAVVLTDFAANCHQGSQILVTWETTSEVGNTGFNLIRGVEGPGTTVQVWFIPSQSPGGTSGASYSFIDSNIDVGASYAYSLESVDLAGATVRYGPVIASCEPPTALKLTGFSATTSPRAPMPWCLSAAVLTAGGMFVVFRHGRRRRSKL